MGIRDPLGNSSPRPQELEHQVLSFLPTRLYLGTLLLKNELPLDLTCGPHLALVRTSQGRILAWGYNQNQCVGEDQTILTRPCVLSHTALHHVVGMAAGDGTALFIRAASDEAMHQQQIRTDLGILSHLNQTTMTSSSRSPPPPLSSSTNSSTHPTSSLSGSKGGGEDRWGKLFSLVSRTSTHGM